MDLFENQEYSRFTINTGIATTSVLVLAKVSHILQIAIGTGLGHVSRRQLGRARVTAGPHFRVEIYLHGPEIHLRPQFQLSHVTLRPQHLKKNKKQVRKKEGACHIKFTFRLEVTLRGAYR